MISSVDFHKISKCPICDNNLTVKYKNIRPVEDFSYSKISFDILYCSNCDLGILNKQIKSRSLKQIYRSNYLEGYRNNIIKKPFLKSVKNNKYLEIGMGTGDQMIDCLNNGNFCEGWGIDINSNSFNKIRKFVNKKVALNLIVNNISKTKLPSNYFDYVYLSHVIEHVNNPLKVIKKLFLSLKTNGVIKIATPNFNSLTNFLLMGKADYSCPHHLYFFTKTSMEKILNELNIDNYQIKFNWGNSLANQLSNRNRFIKIILSPFSILGEIVFQKKDNLEIKLFKKSE